MVNRELRNARTRATWCCAAIALLYGVPAAGAVPALVEASFQNAWVDRGASLRLRFDGLDATDRPRLAVLVGRRDLTALFAYTGPGELSYRGGQLPLPPGQHELVVYQVRSAAQWDEIARVPLQVLTDGGFEEAELTPRLEMSVEMQNLERVRGDAQRSERPSFQDVSLHGSLQTSHRRAGTMFTSQVGLSGASYRLAALRAAQLGERAPRIDLADYAMRFEHGATRAQIGHVSYGQHPFLLSGLSHRGVLVEQGLGTFADFAVTSQSGQRIVGYDRLLGFDRQRNRITGATLGLNMLPVDSPTSLRVEVSHVIARVQAESDFDAGQVPVAERSHGWGIRLLGHAWEQRLRAEAAYARSRYVNPTEDSLEFSGVPIVDVQPSTNSARMLNVDVDVLRGWSVSEALGLDLGIRFEHERIDPLYRTLAAFPTADLLRHRLALRALLGPVALTGGYATQRDNLAGVPTILSTRTRAADLALDTPLAALLGHLKTSSPWWPTLQLSWQRTHQFAINTPDPQLSDFDSASHLPDQVSVQHGVGLQWSVDRWSVRYQFARAFQDNRQPGRELADFTNRDHRVDVGWQLTERLRLDTGLGISRARDHERGRVERSPIVSLGIDWQGTEHLGLAAQYHHNRSADNLQLARSRSDSLSTQISWRFTVRPTEGLRLPGQAFLRYARQANRNEDNEFGFLTQGRIWTLHSGLSFSF